MEQKMNEFAYDVFISYSHRDMQWAKWLQNKLETFRVPKDMAGNTLNGRRLKVFRDQTDLAGAELQASLRKELAASRYLVVLCTPASAASVWVNEEVRQFQSLGREDQILPFIVEGEPDSEDPELECYPPALRASEDRNMLGANIQELGKNKALLKLISVLLDVRFNRLVDRDKQRRRRTALISGTTAAVILAVTGGLIWHNVIISRENQALNYDIYSAAILSISQKEKIEPADVEFLRVSAETGNAEAMFYLADCYEKGMGTEVNPEEAFRWFLQSAEAGKTESMIAVSNCYAHGVGTEVDLESSYEWDLRAAEAGDATGMLNAGICCEEGLGTAPDPEAAFIWYQRSAEAGLDLGMYNYARCWQAGIGTEADPEQAFYWMKQLAETGNTMGMYNLGLMYHYGYGTAESPEQAYQWYRKAAEAGDVNGMYWTGWCIENGYGTSDEAVEWYRRAAESGNQEAKAALERLGDGK